MWVLLSLIPLHPMSPRDGKHWKLDVDAQTDKGRFVDESHITMVGKTRSLKYRIELLVTKTEFVEPFFFLCKNLMLGLQVAKQP